MTTPPQTMRSFLIIWLGQLISMLGSGLTAFALGVWIFEQTRQATPFALTVLFANLPRILLSPVAGVVADRWNRRWVMILADTGNALVTAATFLLLLFGDLQVWHIYLIALTSSIFAAFQEPAYTASVTMLVPKKDLARASGMIQMTQALEMLIVPLIAGVLFAVIGLNGIILIDLITFFFAIAALFIVHIPQPKAEPAEQTTKPSFLSDAGYGWRYLRDRPGLFGLLLYFALVNFFLNFAGVLTAPLVLSFTTTAALGAVQMASGVGMLIGSILMGAWGGTKQRIPAVIGFITLAASGLLLVGLRPSPYLIGAGYFLLLFCVPLASGHSQAIFQTKIAPSVQGRVFAMRNMISRSMMPLAFLIAGPLADRVFSPLLREGGALYNTFIADVIGRGDGRGIGLLFLSSGLILIIAGLLAYATPRIRHVEDELPDIIVETAATTDQDTLPTNQPGTAPLEPATS
jgi:DHA3 family macrolide efflux protein-like MFS transporter